MTQGQSQVNLSASSRQDLLSIHEFAQVCRTTPRTLRFYEKKGLFAPRVVDSFTKYRFYHPKQAKEFLKIKLLQNFHIPLNQISKTVRKNSAEEYLQNELKSLREEILEKEKEYKFLEKIKVFLFEEKDVKNLFQTKTFGPFNLFCMKVEHAEYARITDYIKIHRNEAERLKLECENSEITFYLNNAYNPKNTPLEIALILKNNDSLSLRATAKQSLEIATPREARLAMTDNNFYFKSYPKTKSLVFNYTGPYEYLILIYQKLFSYLEAQKVDLTGLVFETYKYGPLNTKSKFDYKTMIGFPI